MKYDCIIIGGGLAGLTCAIKCSSEGLSTAVISCGASALHIASGSIDLLGYSSGRYLTGDLDTHLDQLIKRKKNHPYAKIGKKCIWESLEFFRQILSKERLNLFSMDKKNHFHITSLGILKPAYLSQRSIFNGRLLDSYKLKKGLVLLNFRGYRDYYPGLAMNQLKKNPLFRDIPLKTGLIELPHYTKTARNMLEFRSIDLARVFEDETYLSKIAEDIRTGAGDADVVTLPDFIGIHNYEKLHARLEEMTGKSIIEIPNLPPSIPGMRIEHALKTSYASHGGEFSSGDRVTGCSMSRGMVEYITTENYSDTRLSAKCYILAAGSFFSGGLKSGYNLIHEPIFNLKVAGGSDRTKWASDQFFSRGSHPFMEFGVETGTDLHPFGADAKKIKNLYCAGAILSGYNPVMEGSGGGVAISTGYKAALEVIKKIKKSSLE